jgi:hypothetical protein
MSTPFYLAELGGYRVDIEATDADGGTTRRDNAGVLAYYVLTFFDQLSPNRTEVSYQRRDITLRGRLMGRWPGSGETRPLAGFPVWISGYPPPQTGSGSAEAVTRADGTFAGTVALGGAGSVYAYFPASRWPWIGSGCSRASRSPSPGG